MRCLHCVVKFQFRSWVALLLGTKMPLRNCVALQLNQEVHCGSYAALQKLKKDKLRCAFTG